MVKPSLNRTRTRRKEPTNPSPAATKLSGGSTKAKANVELTGNVELPAKPGAKTKARQVSNSQLSSSQRVVAIDASDSSPAPAVTRAAALLDELAKSDEPLGLSDIARRLGIAKSSAANLCIALEESALIRRVDMNYALGHKLVELASSYLRKVDLLSEFHAQTRQLRHAASETMLLGLLDHTDVLYLARHDGTQPIRLASDIGRRMPAVCTGLGKAMLSTLTNAEVSARIKSLPKFPVLSSKGVQNLRELLKDLDSTRERGYAVDDEENTAGVCCFAVPIANGVSTGDGMPHAVSVTLLKARLDERANKALRERLIADLFALAASLPQRLDLAAIPMNHR